ncbi:undecaprenyl-phosphate glucose phosphotransferase [Methylosoma difficile]
MVIGLTLWSILGVFETEWTPINTWWLLIVLVTFDIFAEFNELYRQYFDASIFRESIRIIFSWLWTILVLWVVNAVHPIIEPHQLKLFWAWVAVTPIELLSWHIAAISIVLLVKRLGFKKQRVVIYGATPLGAELEKIFKKEDEDIDFLGFFDDRQNYGSDRGIVKDVIVSGNFEDLLKQAREGKIDLVCIALPMRNEPRIRDMIIKLSDTTVSVYMLPDLVTFDLLRSSLRNIKGIPVISVHETPFYGVDGIMKRLFDIFFSSFILLLIAIPMLVIAILVKLGSPGPVIFKQRRYGFKGEEIVVWKFRSMTVCDDGGVVEQAKKNDPRLTKLGAFLRKSSLDEFPQFFNVLQGRMSIVGPRPHAVAHNEFYRGQIQGYMLRHKVKPGITGWAQINGFRGETDTLDKMEGRIQYDLEYIKNWSIWLDVKIIFLTIFKGFFGSKAY